MCHTAVSDIESSSVTGMSKSMYCTVLYCTVLYRVKCSTITSESTGKKPIIGRPVWVSHQNGY